MQFNSVEFLIFFPITLILYFLAPRKIRLYILLIASYIFYMSWNAKYACLMLISTGITFAGGLLIDHFRKQGKEKAKKSVLWIGILSNLAILALFKYANFALATLSKLSLTFGGRPLDYRFDLLLPVGISFYTFQALGYLIDVYRGETEAERHFFRYALFVSFFPQLVAGPIERSKNLLAQMRKIEEIRLWDLERIRSGAVLMLWGFFMKMVIADRAAILVDEVFLNYHMYSGTELAIGAILFAFQIYCDFGSYSMIAIGAAKVMGFSLMENFNTPYFSVSIRDFWRRWHISLSSWFRDYVYIPLGGSRKGKARKEGNLLIVFFLSGVWHGANWTFIVWGLLHGIYLVISDVCTPALVRLNRHLKIRTDCFSWKLLRMVLSFLMVDLAWIFFRAESLSAAVEIIKRIFLRQEPWLLFDGGVYNLGLDRPEANILIVSLLILFLVSLIRYRRAQTLDAFLFTQNLWFQWFVIIGLFVLIFVFGKYGVDFDAKQFIYFQF